METHHRDRLLSELQARLFDRAATGPDPDGAPARLHRFFEAAADPALAAVGGLLSLVPGEEEAELLLAFAGQSPWLSRALIRDPLLLPALARDPFLRREKPERLFHEELAAAVSIVGGPADKDPAARLVRVRDREYLRLGARELGWGAPDEVGRELAALASACLDGGLAIAAAELEARYGAPLLEGPAASPGEAPRRCRFTVIGMGKLGGAELNFSSDIDLIYLYESDAGSAGGLTLHEYFARLAERLTRLVGESCFRVDLRLRPEGSRGPLVNSLPAAERYYESWGRPWERQAWIKARPVAGDRGLGEEVLGALAPYVWPKSGVASAIDDVQGMMRKVRTELRDAGDIKLGPGGIREIEFFVQALQRLWGGRRPELRERSTLLALDRLLFSGLVSAREHGQLGDAYVFLRRVEHRLQLEELRQTQSLPAGDVERSLLARRLGFLDAAAFAARLGAHREAVSLIYGTLGRAPEGPSPPVARLLDPESDRPALVASLSALGFRDPESSADEVALLRGKPRSPFAPTAAGAAARAAPLLLSEAAASPDPDLALRRLVDLVTRGAPSESVLRLAGESPAIARLLVSLFGTSDFLSKILIAHPELLASLVTSPRSFGHPPTGRAEHLAAIGTRLAGIARAGEDTEEDALNLLRRYRNDELLHIGLRDVAGELDSAEVSLALSSLAEALVAATLEVVTPAVLLRYGRPHTTLSVLALGKLGSAEMSYSSDLDLIFVFGDDAAVVDPPPSGSGGSGRDRDAFEVMSRLAQRLIHGLTAHLSAGRLYEVDTRLRPSGQQGALVSSLPGFERYHAHKAALWERLALIKLRTVAGDPVLGAQVEAIAARYVWGGATDDKERDAQAAQAAQEIGRLRARTERELSGEAPGRFNIKSGRGGLLDVEFLVQYLQLVHGPARPALRRRSVAAALDALRAERLLDEETHAALSAGHAFLRRLDGRMRIVHDRPMSELREDPVELDKLARRLGYHGARAGARLLEEYRATTEAIRRLYTGLLPLPPG